MNALGHVINGIKPIKALPGYEALMEIRINGIHAVWHSPGRARRKSVRLCLYVRKLKVYATKLLWMLKQQVYKDIRKLAPTNTQRIHLGHAPYPRHHRNRD